MKNDVWNHYITYLIKWAKDHRDVENYGMSPACFDEWYNNEFQEEDFYDNHSEMPWDYGNHFDDNEEDE